MRESQLEQKLVHHITKLGGIAYKFSSPNRRSVPDRLCVMPNGRAFFVELKAKAKHLRHYNITNMSYCAHWAIQY
jgi:hypothetical protein